jgi:cell division protein FtsI (penicillin-binding protein 3)
MPRDGRDLQLSLDRRLQYLSYRALKRAVLRHRARGGTLLVLDPASGEILAMASQPAGNPNDVAARKPALQRNRAVVDLFEPGSTLKPFTVAAALESGRFAPGTRIQTSPGYLRVGGQTVRDVRDFGELDVAGILRKSSNVGVSKIALALPPENLWRLYAALGFGAEAGLGFPGEQGAQLSHFSNWSRFERAAHSYGYGLAVSTLHLAQAYGVLAADGVLRKPVLIAAERPAPGERILSAATARQIRRMLMAVVGPEGTARAAAVPGYQVGGKTGTVRKHGSGGYQEDRYLAMFVGFAPVERPRFVVAVVLDDPRGEVYYGGQVAAPVFAEVMRGALRLFGVPPDQPPPAATRLLVAHGEGSDGR